MKTSYFTRRTPNTNLWEKPSGPAEKCTASTGLYESRNGFGWEEWLLEDFHSGKDLCNGFLQAFNNRRGEITHAEVIYMYTRICDGVKPKLHYLGCIKDVKILSNDKRRASGEIKAKRLKELADVVISKFPADDPMWENCFNIQFERNNVSLTEQSEECEILLSRGQNRFALYQTIDHPNFLTEIKKCKSWNS
jgi:hypothetical protein